MGSANVTPDKEGWDLVSGGNLEILQLYTSVFEEDSDGTAWNRICSISAMQYLWCPVKILNAFLTDLKVRSKFVWATGYWQR